MANIGELTIGLRFDVSEAQLTAAARRAQQLMEQRIVVKPVFDDTELQKHIQSSMSIVTRNEQDSLRARKAASSEYANWWKTTLAEQERAAKQSKQNEINAVLERLRVERMAAERTASRNMNEHTAAAQRFKVGLTGIEAELRKMASQTGVTTRELMRLETVQKGINSERAKMSSALGAVPTSGAGDMGNLNEMASLLSMLSPRLGNVAMNGTQAASSFGAVLGVSGRMAAGLGVAAVAVTGLTTALAASTREAASLEQGMAGITSIQPDMTKWQAGEMATFFQTLSTELPVTTEHLTGIARNAVLMGVEGSQHIEQFTRSVAELGVATRDNNKNFSDMSAMAEDIAIFLNETGSTAETFSDDMESVVATLAAVDQVTPGTINGVLNLTRYMAAGAVTLNLSRESILGISGALSGLGARAESGGSAVIRVLMSMNRAANGSSEELDTLGEKLGITKDELANLFKGNPTAQLESFARVMGVTTDEARRLINTQPDQAFLKLADGMHAAHGSGQNMALILDELGLKNVRDIRLVDQMTVGHNLLAKAIDAAADADKNKATLQERVARATDNFNDAMTEAKNATVAFSQTAGTPMLEWLTGIAHKWTEATNNATAYFRKLNEQAHAGGVERKITELTDKLAWTERLLKRQQAGEWLPLAGSLEANEAKVKRMRKELADLRKQQKALLPPELPKVPKGNAVVPQKPQHAVPSAPARASGDSDRDTNASLKHARHLLTQYRLAIASGGEKWITKAEEAIKAFRRAGGAWNVVLQNELAQIKKSAKQVSVDLTVTDAQIAKARQLVQAYQKAHDAAKATPNNAKLAAAAANAKTALETWKAARTSNAKALAEVNSLQGGRGTSGQSAYVPTVAELNKYRAKGLQLARQLGEAEKSGNDSKLQAAKKATEQWLKGSKAEFRAKKAVLEIEKQTLRANEQKRVSAEKMLADQKKMQEQLAKELTSSKVPAARATAERMQQQLDTALAIHKNSAAERLRVERELGPQVLAAKKRVLEAEKEQELAANKAKFEKLRQQAYDAYGLKDGRRQLANLPHDVQQKLGAEAEKAGIGVISSTYSTKNSALYRQFQERINTATTDVAQKNKQLAEKREQVEKDLADKLSGLSQKQRQNAIELAEHTLKELQATRERRLGAAKDDAAKVLEIERQTAEGIRQQRVTVAYMKWRNEIADNAEDYNGTIAGIPKGASSAQRQHIKDKAQSLRESADLTSAGQYGLTVQEAFDKAASSIENAQDKLDKFELSQQKRADDLADKYKELNGDIEKQVAAGEFDEEAKQRALKRFQELVKQSEEYKLEQYGLLKAAQAATHSVLENGVANSDAYNESVARIQKIKEIAEIEQRSLEDASITVASLSYMLDELIGTQKVDPNKSGYLELLNEIIQKGGQASEAAELVKRNLGMLLANKGSSTPEAMRYRAEQKEVSRLYLVQQLEKERGLGQISEKDYLAQKEALDIQAVNNRFDIETVGLKKWEAAYIAAARQRELAINKVRDEAASARLRSSIEDERKALSERFENELGELERQKALKLINERDYIEQRAKILEEQANEQLRQGIRHAGKDAKLQRNAWRDWKRKRGQIELDRDAGVTNYNLSSDRAREDIALEERRRELQKHHENGLLTELDYIEQRKQLRIKEAQTELRRVEDDNGDLLKATAEFEAKKAKIITDAEKEVREVTSRLHWQKIEAQQQAERDTLQERYNSGLISEKVFIDERKKLQLISAKTEFDKTTELMNKNDHRYLQTQREFEAKKAKIISDANKATRESESRAHWQMLATVRQDEQAELDYRQQRGYISERDYISERENLRLKMVKDEFDKTTEFVNKNDHRYLQAKKVLEVRQTEIKREGVLSRLTLSSEETRREIEAAKLVFHRSYGLKGSAQLQNALVKNLKEAKNALNDPQLIEGSKEYTAALARVREAEDELLNRDGLNEWQQHIQRVVEDFDSGRVSAREFAKALRAQGQQLQHLAERAEMAGNPVLAERFREMANSLHAMNPVVAGLLLRFKKAGEYIAGVAELSGALAHAAQAFGEIEQEYDQLTGRKLQTPWKDLTKNIEGVSHAAKSLENVMSDISSIVSNPADIGNWFKLVANVISSVADAINGFQKAKAEVAKLRGDFAMQNPYLDAGDYQKVFTRSRGWLADVFTGGPEVVNEIDKIGLQFAQTMQEAFKSGISSGLKEGLLKNDFSLFKDKLRESAFGGLLDGVLSVFLNDTLLKGILGPAIKSWSDALKTPSTADDEIALANIDKAIRQVDDRASSFYANVAPKLQALQNRWNIGRDGRVNTDQVMVGATPVAQLGVPRIEVTLPEDTFKPLHDFGVMLPRWEATIEKFDVALDKTLTKHTGMHDVLSIQIEIPDTALKPLREFGETLPIFDVASRRLLEAANLMLRTSSEPPRLTGNGGLT